VRSLVFSSNGANSVSLSFVGALATSRPERPAEAATTPPSVERFWRRWRWPPRGTRVPYTSGLAARDSVRAMGTVRVGEFEWDDAKAKANVRKHGVTFEEAVTVFLDELAVPLQKGEDPDRLIMVGESQLGRTILVVFTERVASGIIRIISARRATKRERRAYVEGD
jgi:uncharacterized DUF497 family protein